MNKKQVIRCSNVVTTKNDRKTKCDCFIASYDPDKNEIMLICKDCKTRFYIPLKTTLNVNEIRGVLKEDTKLPKMEKNNGK